MKSFEEKPQRPGNRRMATLASVYSVDRYVRSPQEIVSALFRDESERPADRERRPEPCHKHVIARFAEVIADISETEPVSGGLLALNWSAQQIRQRRRPDQTLVRLMDGQHSLWDTAAVCDDEVPEEHLAEILDIVHVSSYVRKATKVFHPQRERQEAFARERLLRIVQGEVRGVITGLRRMATERGLGREDLKEIRAVCGYFEAHCHRMRYDEYLAAGYPIATGVIEGACRHLVKDRLARSGMRWTQRGAQAMLNLRALKQSSFWDQFQQQSSVATELTG
jgi:hypothetical protein